MYKGRDMTELSMTLIEEWSKEELSHFHFHLQQMAPYLNAEGVSFHHQIQAEIVERGGL
ncbi:hypothetical protein [Alkalihalobacillus pseudalcaliphilus]|uniref:hypothetical protein n=1 Tax=Alkalihalobacillus pseudalcaliphilus TaxID=79884 RepID=UPI000B29F5C6|nr:hypothetical protein [Alkalihalobacillus pseudalcaliphilus]